MAKASEPARVVMRLEAYVGKPFIRLFHTVEFLHKDPRRAFVRRMGLHLPLTLSGAMRVTAGGEEGPVTLPDAADHGLTQTSHLDARVWSRAKGERHRVIHQATHRSRGWIDVANDQSGVAVVLRDMWKEAPKELVVREDRGVSIDADLWPASCPLMDVRRYSNYPHRAQGESVSWDPEWVLKSYYPNAPFVGVSKSHVLTLIFHPGELDVDEIDAAAADVQSRPLVYSGWKRYADAGVTLPAVDPSDENFKRSTASFFNVAKWWLFHQKAYGWYGMWDYGDVRHRYRSGYGRIFTPDGLRKLLAMPESERDAKYKQFEHRQDYFTQNDWAFDNGRWGWSNTEGLCNYAMSLAYLMTGDRDLFFFVEANARHVRDVDARHAGKFFGRGTRHGVQHWSDGNHEERQTTFTEQRFHYLLTGEHRTREWNRTLSDEFYLTTTCRNHASHSGRSYGLLFRWEITGDPKLEKIMRNYMRVLAQPEGIAISADVAFPEAKIVGEPEDVNGGSMFFHVFGAMHAMLEYYYLTGDEVVRDSIIKTADHAIDHASNRRGVGNYRKAVAFAARHASDGDKYRQALRDWITGAGSGYAFEQVSHNPMHWHGPGSFLRGNVSGGLFWFQDASYVMGALAKDPELSEKKRAEFDERSAEPVIPERRIPPESWQSEFDQPEFDAYLRDRMMDQFSQ